MSSLQQPFPYLDNTCILWCTSQDTALVKQHLSSHHGNDPIFFGSFLNNCLKAVNHRSHFNALKDSNGLNDNELAIWKCLYQCYIPADQLISLMQEYAKEKYKRGATLKGVVNLTKGPAGDEALAAAQLELYNKVFSIGEKEMNRKQRERDAGLVPLERPHPGLERVREKRRRNTETRKKRKFGDEVEDVDPMDSMRKMKKSLPSFNFGVDEEVKSVAAKKHDDLVVTDKGKERETVVRSEEKEDES
ncbi:hypothetical protein KCV07_g5547, partial [Aureobasidium melanogenum]